MLRDRGGRVTAAIRRFTDAWNDRREPFSWTRPTGEIPAKAIPGDVINVTSGGLCETQFEEVQANGSPERR
jgi:hypothetical protein